MVPRRCTRTNPGLIYARLTGWGQTGPYAKKVGHDINYLAISGTLGQIGTDRPTAPPAFLGDLANGSYTLVIGILLALVERQRTGKGQVVDAAIVDGAAYMLGGMFGELELGLWDGDLKNSMLGGTAPFYGVYECADGRWFSIGSIEPKFYAALLDILGLDDVDRLFPRAARPEGVAGPAGADRGDLPDEDAGRMDRDFRTARSLRRARARPGRIADPSAARRPRHHPRRRQGPAQRSTVAAALGASRSGQPTSIPGGNGRRRRSSSRRASLPTRSMP